MNSKLLIILAALIALAVGGAPGAYPAPPKDACSMLSAARVSSVLGATVEVGKVPTPGDCERSQPGVRVGSKRLFLHILGTMGKLTPAEQFNTIKMPLPVKGITKTPVSGLGDDAVYGVVGQRPPELTVKKGESVFQVTVFGFPPEEAKSKEKDLALDVLAKL